MNDDSIIPDHIITAQGRMWVYDAEADVYRALQAEESTLSKYSWIIVLAVLAATVAITEYL